MKVSRVLTLTVAAVAVVAGGIGIAAVTGFER